MRVCSEFDDENLNRWLLRHGIVFYGNYGVQQCRNMSDYVFHRNHYTREYRHFAINMALNSPIPHPWCWFCHSFGRFNCFLFHILQQGHNNGPAIREPGQLPLYLRQSTRNGQAEQTIRAESSRPPRPNLVPPQPHAPQPRQKPIVSNGKVKKTKIAYFEIEIRPNVRNVPPNLNRFFPYHVPVDSSEDSSTDSSPCSSPTPDTAENMSTKTLWEPASRAKKPKK